jgi:DNA-binding LacI/PurR family transcriptional regulator
MGYKLFLCNSDRSAEKERTYVDALMESMVDGLILMKTRLSVPLLAEISAMVSVALIDTCGDENSIGCDFIGVNDYDAIKQALEFLWNYNHRRIAMIAGPQDSLSARDRLRAFRDFFAPRGYSPGDINIQYGSYDWHSGYGCANRLLNGSSPPTAVLAANDLMAIGAMKAIQERGFSIPGDISVMGFDDIDMASLCIPALTTLRQPKYEMGEYSARTLIGRIESGLTTRTSVTSSVQETGCTVRVLKTELVVRDSVSLCKSGGEFRPPGKGFTNRRAESAGISGGRKA